MNIFLQKTNSVLPLKISYISWDDITFVLSGTNWSFSTQSAWRVLNNKKIIFGCSDVNIKQNIDSLNNCSITTISLQSMNIEIDPIFEISNGNIIEIFSTITFEPWILSLPNNITYIGDSG